MARISMRIIAGLCYVPPNQNVQLLLLHLHDCCIETCLKQIASLMLSTTDNCDNFSTVFFIPVQALGSIQL